MLNYTADVGLACPVRSFAKQGPYSGLLGDPANSTNILETPMASVSFLQRYEY